MGRLWIYGSSAHSHAALISIGREGLTFTRGYTTAPVCSPSLASIMPVELENAEKRFTSGGGDFISVIEEPQLFNIVADPHERTNLAEENPRIVEKLIK